MAPTSTFGSELKRLREAAPLTENEKRKKRGKGPLTREELGWRLINGTENTKDREKAEIRSAVKAIIRWEEKGVIPSPGMIQKLSDALGVDPNILAKFAHLARQSRGAPTTRGGTDDHVESDGRSNRLPVLEGRVMSEEDRARLERIARDAAIAGGIAAMGYFRSVLQPLVR